MGHNETMTRQVQLVEHESARSRVIPFRVTIPISAGVSYPPSATSKPRLQVPMAVVESIPGGDKGPNSKGRRAARRRRSRMRMTRNRVSVYSIETALGHDYVRIFNN